MIEKFNNKYLIASARMQGWDYGADAIYFVTICTNDRQHYFGDIENNTMQLNSVETPYTGVLLIMPQGN